MTDLCKQQVKKQYRTIPRRILLKGSLVLAGAIFTTTFRQRLSKTAENLLIYLSEFDLTEGAKIDDLVYVSELQDKQVKYAVAELIEHSLIYSQGQGRQQTFFIKSST